MKKTILSFIILLCSFLMNAQDTLYQRDGSKILITLVKEGETLEYRKTHFIDGPLYVVHKTEIRSIHYANGHVTDYNMEPLVKQGMITAPGPGKPYIPHFSLFPKMQEWNNRYYLIDTIHKPYGKRISTRDVLTRVEDLNSTKNVPELLRSLEQTQSSVTRYRSMKGTAVPCFVVGGVTCFGLFLWWTGAEDPVVADQHAAKGLLEFSALAVASGIVLEIVARVKKKEVRYNMIKTIDLYNQYAY
jgi:hypothetical protein